MSAASLRDQGSALLLQVTRYRRRLERELAREPDNPELVRLTEELAREAISITQQVRVQLRDNPLAHPSLEQQFDQDLTDTMERW